MNTQFHALALDRQHAPAAYPLMYLHDAGITPAKWLRAVGRLSRSRSGRTGVIAIRDCREIVHALFSYRIDGDLHSRKRFCITDLIVAHIPGSQIDAAVAAAATAISAELGCQAITIERPFPSLAGSRAGCPTAAALRRRPAPATGSRLQ
jgi:hypothetical protein